MWGGVPIASDRGWPSVIAGNGVPISIGGVSYCVLLYNVVDLLVNTFFMII